MYYIILIETWLVGHNWVSIIIIFILPSLRWHNPYFV